MGCIETLGSSTVVLLTQDQWDIYKLDPVYDCLVRRSPELSAVRPAAIHVANHTQPMTHSRYCPPSIGAFPQDVTMESFSRSESSFCNLERDPDHTRKRKGKKGVAFVPGLIRIDAPFYQSPLRSMLTDARERSTAIPRKRGSTQSQSRR